MKAHCELTHFGLEGPRMFLCSLRVRPTIAIYICFYKWYLDIGVSYEPRR